MIVEVPMHVCSLQPTCHLRQIKGCMFLHQETKIIQLFVCSCGQAEWRDIPGMEVTNEKTQD